MRVFIQLDVQNLFFAAKDINKLIDFKKIKSTFENSGDEIFSIKAYTVKTPEIKSGKFENLLKMLNYDLNSKSASITYDKDGGRHFHNTDQDMAICVDCMDNIDNFDKWVLMSGDGDFIDLIKHLKDKGKKVEVWTLPGKSFNKRICDYVDAVNFLSDDFFYDKSKKGDS
jgi:uncharacterized LabA/DUF88 family protein